MTGQSSQTLRALRLLAWLVLLLVGQWAQVPHGVALPRAAQIVADAGVHVPVVQSKPLAIAARLEVRADPPQKSDLPPLSELDASLLGDRAGGVEGCLAPAGVAIAVAKGFWACAPPSRVI